MMRSVAIVFLLLFPSLVTAADLQAMRKRADLLGWEAVGRLDIGRDGFCTGTLVATTMVLTAAHCVIDTDTGERHDPATMTFRAGRHDGTEIAARGVARIAVPPAYESAGDNPYVRTRNDIALLELSEPVPSAAADPYRPARRIAEGDRLVAITYGAGRHEHSSREGDCHMRVIQRGIAWMNCRGDPGSSGGPLFDLSSGVPRIAAIVSGAGEWDGHPVTVGPLVGSALPDLTAALRAGRNVWPEAAPARARRIGPDNRRIIPGKPAGGARFVRP